MMQPEFLEGCIEACRREGVHTALDTSGCASREELIRIAARVDLVLFDLKLMDSALHRELVGADLEPILANLEALVAAGIRIWIRTPVVPGINDTVQHMSKIARLVARLGTIEKTCLLPFHRAAEAKRTNLAMDSGFSHLAAERSLEELEAPFRDEGLAVQIGG